MSAEKSFKKRAGVYGIKNREASEKRRPSVHYVDLSSLMVFSKDDLDKELAKIPEQKLRRDDEFLLNRSPTVKRAPSLTPSSDPLFPLRDTPGSRNDDRRRSSVLSVVSSSCSRPSSPLHPSSKSFNSFFELSKALSHVDDGSCKPQIYPYPNPVPPALRFIEMKDLLSTDIDWKMLTMARPAAKIDEDFYSRFVECARLHEKASLSEGNGMRRILMKLSSRHPKSPSFFGRYQARHVSDQLADLDFDPDIDYDSYAREEPNPEDLVKNEVVENATELVSKLFGDDSFGTTTNTANTSSANASSAEAEKPSSSTSSPTTFINIQGRRSKVTMNVSGAQKTITAATLLSQKVSQKKPNGFPGRFKTVSDSISRVALPGTKSTAASSSSPLKQEASPLASNVTVDDQSEGKKHVMGTNGVHSKEKLEKSSEVSSKKVEKKRDGNNSTQNKVQKPGNSMKNHMTTASTPLKRELVVSSDVTSNTLASKNKKNVITSVNGLTTTNMNNCPHETDKGSTNKETANSDLKYKGHDNEARNWRNSESSKGIHASVGKSSKNDRGGRNTNKTYNNNKNSSFRSRSLSMRRKEKEIVDSSLDDKGNQDNKFASGISQMANPKIVVTTILPGME